MQGSDGRPNGSAYILFDRPESAANAVCKFNVLMCDVSFDFFLFIAMFHNSELDGRKIEVQLDRLGDF